MTKIYIPFYIEWMDFIDKLPDEDYLKLVKSIFDFARGRKKKKPHFNPGAEMAYNFITSAMRRCEGKRGYTEIISAQNPSPKKREAKVFKRIERNGSESVKNEESKSTFPTQNDIFDKPQQTNATKSDFSRKDTNSAPTNKENGIPTRDEVRNFFKKRGFRSNPDEFYNFYESNGWRVGQNRMQNWHSSAENWDLRVEKESPRPTNATETSSRAGDFDVNEAFCLALERSYGNMDDDEE